MFKFIKEAIKRRMNFRKDLNESLTVIFSMLPLSDKPVNIPASHPYKETIAYYSGERGHVKLTSNGPDVPTFLDQNDVICIKDKGGQVYRIIYA